MDEQVRPGWFTRLVSRRAANAQAGVVKKITLYAEALPGNLYGHGPAPGRATVPDRVLEIDEGDTLEITLVDNTGRRMSIHPHGVDYGVESDGSPLDASFNNPGETRTCTWRSRHAVATAGRRPMPGKTVVIGRDDTRVANVDTCNGYTVSDLVDQHGEYPDHGTFVRHVELVTADLVTKGAPPRTRTRTW